MTKIKSPLKHNEKPGDNHPAGQYALKPEVWEEKHYAFPADDVDEEEDYDVAFLSNGLKFRNTDSWANENDKTYFFMAFAETPFKYANGK